MNLKGRQMDRVDMNRASEKKILDKNNFYDALFAVSYSASSINFTLYNLPLTHSRYSWL